MTGQVASEGDGNGHLVAFTPASGSNNAVPGAITPNGDGRFTTNYSYNSFLGATSVSGPNGASSGSGFDGFGRLASATSAHGASTTYSYSYSPPMVTATVNGRWTRTTMDGFGRAVKVEKGDSGSTKSVVDVVYDSAAVAPLGLRKLVSRPYAPGAQPYSTSYSYDGRGRVTSVLLPGGTGANTTSYAGNTQTTADAAGKWKMYTRDVFGNLTMVTEPNPAGGANLITQHSFDVYNRLKQVSMTRSGTTQTRTFTYDPATQRLSSVQHPESGLASYTYNADGSLAARTDAKGQKVAYSYDSMGRVTQVRRYPNGVSEDPCQRDTYSWDSNPYDASYSVNAVGRVTAMQYGGTTCSAATLFTDMYSYTPAGRMAGKRLRLNRGNNDADLNASFTYNNEGQLTSKQYPNGGTTYTYGFDSMARPVSLTDSGLRTWVNNVNWNADGSLGQIGVWNGTAYWNETRSFNARGQMTRQTVPGMLDMEYRYSPTANNGQITQSKDWMSNQEVTYGYDSLSRLSSAATTNSSQWGLSFSFDGFGNRTNSTVTQGSGPYFSMAFDAATNRMVGSGIGYDLNGNLINQTGVSYGYDVENRLVNYSNAEYYVYGPGNRRVWKRTPSGAEEVYFYDPSGNRMGVYSPRVTGGTLSVQNIDTNLTFAGAVVNARGSAVLRDRLGSVRASGGGSTMYFPFGEEQGGGTGNDREKFGTYYRDQTTGLDYAQNRYYANQFGAFVTPDRGTTGAWLGSPQSWNRYSYVDGDPTNENDPDGQCSVVIGGITQIPYTSETSAEQDFAQSVGAISAYPYAAAPSAAHGLLDVIQQGMGIVNAATQNVLNAIALAAQSPGPIDVVAYSGGAQALNTALASLTPQVISRIRNVTYVSPGSLQGPPLARGTGTTSVFLDSSSGIDMLVVNNLPADAALIETGCGHNGNCVFSNFADQLALNTGEWCETGAGAVFGAGTPAIRMMAPPLIPGIFDPFYVPIDSGYIIPPLFPVAASTIRYL